MRCEKVEACPDEHLISISCQGRRDANQAARRPPLFDHLAAAIEAYSGMAASITKNGKAHLDSSGQALTILGLTKTGKCLPVAPAMPGPATRGKAFCCEKQQKKFVATKALTHDPHQHLRGSQQDLPAHYVLANSASAQLMPRNSTSARRMLAHLDACIRRALIQPPDPLGTIESLQ